MYSIDYFVKNLAFAMFMSLQPDNHKNDTMRVFNKKR